MKNVGKDCCVQREEKKKIKMECYAGYGNS